MIRSGPGYLERADPGRFSFGQAAQLKDREIKQPETSQSRPELIVEEVLCRTFNTSSGAQTR
jgi:hypothetical protein